MIGPNGAGYDSPNEVGYDSPNEVGYDSPNGAGYDSTGCNPVDKERENIYKYTKRSTSMVLRFV